MLVVSQIRLTGFSFVGAYLQGFYGQSYLTFKNDTGQHLQFLRCLIHQVVFFKIIHVYVMHIMDGNAPIFSDPQRRILAILAIFVNICISRIPMVIPTAYMHALVISFSLIAVVVGPGGGPILAGP